MEAAKRVHIGVGELQLKLLRVTKVDVDEQLDSDITKTFDEPVSSPSNDGGYKIDMSLIEARTLEEFKTLKKIVNRLKTEDGEVSVYETVKHREGDFEQENHFSGVRVTGNKVSFDAENLTARDLSFNAESMREIIDGEEIE